MAIEFSLAVPTLVTQDLDATIRFFRDQLGFTINYQEDRFCSFNRGETYIHFAQTDLEVRSNRGGWDAAKPADVSFFVDDVKALHESYVANGTNIESPPTERPYGIIDMDIVDVNGYVLRFNEALLDE